MNFCILKKILGLKKTLNKSHAPKNIINEEVKTPEDKLIVSETNSKGMITFANSTFIEMSGYKKNELLCANHNIIRHPDMPQIVFKFLWDTVKQGNPFEGYVKNLRKDGKYYLVYAKIQKKGNNTYISVREKVNYNGYQEVFSIYEKLLEEEKKGGMEASYKKFKNILGTSDDNFYNSYMNYIRKKQYGN